MRTVRVSLGDRSYTIKIGSGLLAGLGRDCSRLGLGRQCAVISDRNVAPRFARPALASLERAGFDPVPITISSGETAKRLETVHRCLDQLARHRLERAAFIVALGGGVIGDLAGFVAATYLRGIHFVQVPTTLLAQVDSSVGGKVGVNLAAGKNLVGAFHQPRLVLCDLDTLKTLPEREYRSGLAEVVKYGVIRDRAFFFKLERDMPRLLRRDPRTLAEVVARCCRIKASVVAHDERESGLRAILNFGHTVGHALEAVAGYGEYLHGEAISIGQAAAAAISREAAGLPLSEANRISQLLKSAGLPVALRLDPQLERKLLETMKLDKKARSGEMRFVLAPKIGRAEHGRRVSEAVLRNALQEVNERGSSRLTEPGTQSRC